MLLTEWRILYKMVWIRTALSDKYSIFRIKQIGTWCLLPLIPRHWWEYLSYAFKIYSKMKGEPFTSGENVVINRIYLWSMLKKLLFLLIIFTTLTFSDCVDSTQDPLTSTEEIIKTVEGFSTSKMKRRSSITKSIEQLYHKN